jgi:hypothetical protein
MVHKNDMTYWDEIGCKRGCERHVWRSVRVDLSKPHGYGDLTPIPSRFGIQFDIDVWDTSITPVDGGPYCPARDAVSETILSHGIWEPAETAIMLMCFEALPGGLFIDFGSQIGWFSSLAALNGMTVVAMDADPDCVDLTHRNLIHNAHLLGSIGSHYERLGPDTAPFSYNAQRVDLPTVVKIDVEGAEVDAIRKIQALIDDGWVKYMLIEISPVFNDTYGGLINGLVDVGFVPYMLPPKRTPPVALNRLSDLEGYELPHEPRDIARYIEGLHQADLFFALGGL